MQIYYHCRWFKKEKNIFRVEFKTNEPRLKQKENVHNLSNINAMISFLLRFIDFEKEISFPFKAESWML